MTNREKINELGGVLLEPEGSGSDKYFLMVSEKWLDSEYKEPDHIADTSEMVEPTKNDLAVDAISRQALLNATVKKSSIWNKITDSEGNNLETIISKLPSATTRTRWIPVSEKLPNDRDWYLGIFREPDTGWINPLPFICDYVGRETKATTKEHWILRGLTDIDNPCDYYLNLECVAWMPLPLPWKGE